MDVETALNFLGYKVEDKVTKQIGVVVSISFELYGCIQGLVVPEVDEKGARSDSRWYDIGRLVIISDEPVMAQPTFVMVRAQKTSKKSFLDPPGPAGDKPSVECNHPIK